MEAISVFAIMASVVVNSVLGSIWYGPLFGRRWMLATGRNPSDPIQTEVMKKDMPSAMASMFIFSLVTAIILSILTYRYSGNVQSILVLALMLWLGFSLPLKVNDVFFGGRSKELLWIDSLWSLLSIVVTALIVGLWR